MIEISELAYIMGKVLRSVLKMKMTHCSQLVKDIFIHSLHLVSVVVPEINHESGSLTVASYINIYQP